MTYVAKIQVEMNQALDPWIYRRSQADSRIWMMKTKELRIMKGTHGRKKNRQIMAFNQCSIKISMSNWIHQKG